MFQRFLLTEFLTGSLPWLRLTLALLALRVAAAPDLATAAEVQWANPADGFFHFGTNWTGGRPPNADDGAVFDLDSSGYGVIVTTNVNTAYLEVRSDNVGLLLPGGVTWKLPQSNSPTLYLGSQADDVATLRLIGGGRLESGGTIVGLGPASQGTLIVDGPSTHLASQYLIAGVRENSYSTIKIQNGGKISSNASFVIARSSDSSGIVEVTGAGSSLEVGDLLHVGEVGFGWLTVDNSARVDVGGLALGGHPLDGNSESHGIMHVRNSDVTVGSLAQLGVLGTGGLDLDNSTFTSNQFQVGSGFGGSYGRGELKIRNGSILSSFAVVSTTSTSATIAAFRAESSGSVLVTGAGSKWLQDGNFSVGSVGTGTLRIEDQGYVESKDAQVARTATASAEVQVDGDGSQWVIQDRLIIGGAFTAAGGNATVDVTDNGLIKVGEQLHLWEQGTLDVSQQGAVIVGDSDGSIVSTVLVSVGGALSGTGTIIGDVLVTGGTLAPGASPGTLYIDGDVLIDQQSILSIELAGTATGLFDQLNVTGDLSILGMIEVSLLDGFGPQVGDTFMFFDVGGTLDVSQASFALPAGLSLVSIGSGEFQVRAVPEPATGTFLLLSFALLSRRVRRIPAC